MRHIVFCILILSILMNSLCSKGNTHSSMGGGGSETTNSRVALSSGEPARFAKVYVIDNENWYSRVYSGFSVIVDSALTDHDGEFTIDKFDSISCNLQITCGDEGLFIEGYNDSAISSSLLALNRTGSVSIQRILEYDTELLLYGTAYRDADEDESGLKISDIAPGSYFAFGITHDSIRSSSVLDIQESDSVELDSLDPESNWIVVDDFQNLSGVDGKSRLGRITDAYWYPFNDKEVEGAEAWLERTIEQESGGNRYYRIKSVLKQDANYSWAGFGSFLNSTPLDFTGFEGLSLRARGNGVLRFTLENNTVNSLTEQSHNFGVNCTLSTSFETYTIPFDSLEIGIPDSVLNGYTVDDLKREVLSMEFTFHEHSNPTEDTLRADIDDIRFYGAGMNRFMLNYSEN